MRDGVTMWDPESTYVDCDVHLARDVSLLPGTVLKGRCRIGEGTQVGPHAFLTDVVVGSDCLVGTVEATNVRVGDHASVGSFNVLEPGHDVRPGEVVAPGSRRHSD
jgi:bifunctional UDP-N-acetylglucosamine pyrophosphorylase/glucosamine-1-phosphate N-acetyltransferase